MFNLEKNAATPQAVQVPFKALFEARNLAVVKMNRKARERIDGDIQLFQRYLPALGYEVDWRKSKPDAVKFTHSPDKDMGME